MMRPDCKARDQKVSLAIRPQFPVFWARQAGSLRGEHRQVGKANCGQGGFLVVSVGRSGQGGISGLRIGLLCLQVEPS